MHQAEDIRTVLVHLAGTEALEIHGQVDEVFK